MLNTIKTIGIFALFRHLFRRMFLIQFWDFLIVKKVNSREKIYRIFEKIEKDKSSADSLVSVILPVNNGRSHGVERLVDSLKNQTHKKIEFIAVDSGSSDDTVSWLKKNSFTVLQIEPSKFNHAYSRNLGASRAKGDYLLFVVDDVVFYQKNWIECSLKLLNFFKADALSSSQIINNEADHYAKILFNSLHNAQSRKLGFNISRSNYFSTIIRKVMPFQTKLKSICIDDTNHLVKTEVFNNIKFQKETVEDIDFAIRLVNLGYKTIYTNIISVIHYHNYPISQIKKYAKRVYIDNKIFFSTANPFYAEIDNRDAFALSAILIHSAFLKEINTLKDMGAEYYSNKIWNNLNDASSLHLNYKMIHKSSLDLFKSLFCKSLPDIYLIDDAYIQFLFPQFKDLFIVAVSNNNTLDQKITISLFNHLWVNRMMFYMAQNNIFKNNKSKYHCDDWKFSDWS